MASRAAAARATALLAGASRFYASAGWAASSTRAASTSAPAAAATPALASAAARVAAPHAKHARQPATLHTGAVDVPEGVTVSLEGDTLTLTGPLGTSTTSLARLDGRGDGAVRLAPGGRAIEVASVSKPFFGTLTSLLRSKIEGVTRGFLVYLRITGIGYRASLAGQTLTFKLGHSHDCTYTLPPSLRAVVPEPTRVGIYGLDKNQVTQAAANIVALRPPSVYKGKGVRLEGTEVRLKPGKRK